MASTNKTTNYELSQFVGSDKPAWLGDYNQDMGKIDAQMKVNADAVSTVSTTVAGHTTAIAGNTSDIATLQSSVSTISGNVTDLTSAVSTNTTNIATNAGDIDTLETRCGTIEDAQSAQGLRVTSLESDNTTNIANIATNTSDIADLESKLNSFETKFNLTNKTNITSISGYSSIVESCDLSLAQNADGSIFKVYGKLFCRKSSTTSVALTAITGLSGYYGIKTTLKLTTPPEEAYLVVPAGFRQEYVAGQDKVGFIGNEAFAVDTDGYIYFTASSSNTLTYTGNRAYVSQFYPCIYFNASFGDKPDEEQQ